VSTHEIRFGPWSPDGESEFDVGGSFADQEIQPSRFGLTPDLPDTAVIVVKTAETIVKERAEDLLGAAASNVGDYTDNQSPRPAFKSRRAALPSRIGHPVSHIFK
jgi:hypothetical protein